MVLILSEREEEKVYICVYVTVSECVSVYLGLFPSIYIS